MMKKIIIAGVVIVVIVILLVVFGISNLGPIIKAAVNTYGPKITKTDVRLGDVGFSIFSGEAKMKDFYLGNPKGFKSPEAMTVNSFYVDVVETSLTGNPIVINKIEVVAPEITYEKKGKTDNFQTILNAVKQSAKTEKAAEKKTKKTEDTGGGKKIIINDFIITKGKVNLVSPIPGGESVSAALPDIHIKDIGKEKEGITPAEAFEIVFAELYKGIQSPSVEDALNQGLKQLDVDVDGKGKVESKDVKSITDGVKGILDN